MGMTSMAAGNEEGRESTTIEEGVSDAGLVVLVGLRMLEKLFGGGGLKLAVADSGKAA